MNLIKTLSVIVCGILVITACKKKVKTEVIEIRTAPGLPSVTTLAVDSLSSSSAVLSGQITREGNGDVAVAGFCWSDVTTPIVDQTPTSQQLPASRFRYRLTGLKPGTKYSFRAYATNEKGVGYGEVISFETSQGWKKLETGQGSVPYLLNNMVSTGTKLVGASNNNIYSSADNGLTWSSASSSLMGSIYCIANLGEILFAGCSNGLYISNNGGALWVPANSSVIGGNTISYLKAYGNVMFAASNYSLFRSTDNGQNWALVNVDNTFNYVSAITSQGNSVLLFKGSSVFQSDDGGSNWTSTQLMSVIPSMVSATNDALLGISNQQIVRSVDKGKTWASTNLTGYFNDIVTFGNRAITSSGFNNSIYLSNDNGKSWINNNGGLENMTIGSFVFHKDYLLASTYSGIYKLTLN